MTDNETKKALEEYIKENEFEYFHSNTMGEYRLIKSALTIINQLQAENERLEYNLLGVMHFVDKWLDDAELKQDEVNRASVMREKTLQIVENLQAEIERLKAENKSAIDDLKHCMYFANPKNNNTCNFCSHDGKSGSCPGRENWIECNPIWRGFVKEMVGEEE